MANKKDMNMLKKDLGFSREHKVTESKSKEYKKLMDTNQALPPNIIYEKFGDDYDFYEITDSDLSVEDMDLLIKLEHLNSSKKIEFYLKYFFVLSIIGIVIGAIALLVALS